MHASRGRLCRSWCQIVSCNSIAFIERSFDWTVMEAEAGNISYKDLLNRDMHGRGMSTWTMVTERNRRRGVDNMLHVLAPTDRKEPEQNAKGRRIQYGQIIPLSTLPSTELESFDFHRPLPPPRHFLDYHPEYQWNMHSEEVSNGMRDLTAIDSVESTIYLRTTFGSRVRIRSANDSSVSLEALKILQEKTDPFLMLSSVHWAIIGGNENILRSLLEAGEGPRDNFDGNITSFHLAMLWDTESLFHLLTDSRFVSGSLEGEPMAFNGDYPLHFAAAYATSSKIWRFIWKNLPEPMINRENKLGETPSHRACAMGNAVAANSLLIYRADVNRVDDKGRTPLWHAACSDHDGRITRILLSAGANSTFPDLDGLAPVHVSCRQGTVGCLKQLITKGNNVNLTTGALGLLPIQFAATFGHTECVQALLGAGAKILSDVGDGPVVNALHVAIANGHDSSARAIWNSTVRTPDFRGWSPCIRFETRGPVLQWMHVEVNDQYWFAIDDPLKEGGTRDFLCSSPEDETPKLWVDLFA